LSSAITLAFFIPLLIDSGGNTGSQSAMLMIRALATGDVTASNWLRTLSKEVIVSVMLGLTLALLSAVLGVFRGGPIVGLIIALSMVCIIIISNLIGSILPFLLTRMRLDPAVASGPLVTSIVDATSLFIYLSIATALLT
ncbi:MAG: magnesium transporter, partial [Candidatus Peribacteraceae bacterium]